MRQAWLIIAHNEFDILQRLVSMLDDERSDLFIHFDKKVEQQPVLKTTKGRLYILKDRVDVRWGSVSQIKAELVLLEAALKQGPHVHYHILSGTHLPLKPVNELIDFYDSHSDEEVMRCWPTDDGDADFKLRRYHFPLRNYKYGGTFQRRVCQLTWQSVIKVQKVLGIRHMKELSFVKTDNWLSLTEMAARFLTENQRRILKKYKWSFCGDEYFVASELTGRPEEFKLYDCKELLYVEFLNDTPKSFTLNEYESLQETGYWWARKFIGSHAN